VFSINLIKVDISILRMLECYKPNARLLLIGCCCAC